MSFIVIVHTSSIKVLPVYPSFIYHFLLVHTSLIDRRFLKVLIFRVQFCRLFPEKTQFLVCFTTF